MAKVAVIQLVSSANIIDNLNALTPYFIQASEAGAELVVLPENFALMGKHEHDKLVLAEYFGEGGIQETIALLAKQFKLWIVAGTMPLYSDNHQRVRASCLVYDNLGACVARYDKIHLFDVCISNTEAYQESLTVEAGDELVVVDTPIGRIGLSVCYDVRFPALYARLREQGAQLFTVPSAFTAVTGAAHWETLLRARAIENLCYVLAPNQGGCHENGRHTYGHSMIIDPWGKVLAEQENSTGVIIADIDLTHLSHLRKQFPCNEHHKLFPPSS